MTSHGDAGRLGLAAQDFRTIIRAMTSDGTKQISAVVHEIFDRHLETDKINSSVKFLTPEGFDQAASSVRLLRQKLAREDLQEIFDSIDESQSDRIDIDQIVNFCQKTVSKGRVYALKSRTAAIAQYKTEAEYRRIFSEYARNNKYLDTNGFLDYIEDMLNAPIEEADGAESFAIYDMDGDGKISLEDFVGFLTGKTAEVSKALEAFNGQSIVDIKISNTVAQYTGYLGAGYTQVLPDTSNLGANQNSLTQASEGTFGKGQSMWIWRRHQGTFAGRLKPIVDIQLVASSTSTQLANTSTPLALNGYTCIPATVSGQYVWIKRAVTDEDEKDAIVDVRVSVGKMRIPTDKIWLNPGVGWVRVEGNFSKGLFSWTDSFVWFRPLRTRSMDSHLAAPVRTTASLSDEERNTRLALALRMAVRHHVPLREMQRVVNEMKQRQLNQKLGDKPITETPDELSQKFSYSSLFHHYDQSKCGRLTFGQLKVMLFECGLNIDRADMQRCFRFFNTSADTLTLTLDKYITRDEYVFLLNLTDYEIDLAIDLVKQRLLAAAYATTPVPMRPQPSDSGASGGPGMGVGGAGGAADGHPTATSSGAGGLGGGNGQPLKAAHMQGTIIPSVKVARGMNKLRENRMISQIFQTLNTKVPNVLSHEEMARLMAKLEIYMTEEELSKMMHQMDEDRDDRIEEKEFIAVMNSPSSVISKKAMRVREATGVIRRWLHRGSSTGNAPRARWYAVDMTNGWTLTGSTRSAIRAPETITRQQWVDLKRLHEQASGTRFPGFVSSEDLMVLLSSLGERLSSTETREVALLIAGDKNGRIQESDFNAFITRKCRTAGELVALLEKAVMKPVIEAYRKYASTTRGASGDTDLLEAYLTLVKAIVQDVQRVASASSTSVSSAQTTMSSNLGGSSQQQAGGITHEVVSVSQLKIGIESVLKDAPATTQALFPNVEEWAYLACLVGADVAEEETYGVRVREFVEGVCTFIIGGMINHLQEDHASLDAVCKDLQRMIREEARLHGRGGRPDYYACFHLFDADENHRISNEEFKNMLLRLRLTDSLPDSQLPKLIEMLDKKKKGYITYDDFVAFVDSHKDMLDDDFDTVDVDMDKADALKNSAPPAAVTRNADCDWLIWHIWRRANKLNSADPESLITKLENTCGESEILQQKGTVTLAELWDIFLELKLTGDMMRPQFEKGIKFVLMEGIGKDSDEVDYEALCRYTVRMGRAYNELIQESLIVDEKKYKELKIELKKELLSIGMTTTTAANGQKMYKFEKVFRRLDQDGDGQISMQELKQGLRKLKLRGEKLWSMKMLKRLFYEIDKDHSGSISIKELAIFVQNPNNDDTLRYDPTTDKLTTGGGSTRPPKASSSASVGSFSLMGDGAGADEDEDDDDLLFGRHNRGATGDVELIRKVTDIVHHMMPVQKGVSPEHHLEEVKANIRRFFHKADTDSRGLVSEDKFRSFLRKSGMVEKLSAGEIRKLIEKLRRKHTTSVANSTILIDYERFLKMLSSNPLTIPHSKGEAVLLNLQEASIASAAQGRAFIGLCSLVDQRQQGVLTAEELIHTAKMIGCTLSGQDVEALREILPDSCFDSRGSIDYRELHYYIQIFTPRGTLNLDYGDVMRPPPTGRPGALPLYASPGRTSLLQSDGLGGRQVNTSLDFGSTVKTPLGTSIALSPFRGGRTGALNHNNGIGGTGGVGRDPATVDKILYTVVERLKLAMSDRSRDGMTTPLYRIFERYDAGYSGYIPLHRFLGVVEDIGVPLSASELQAVQLTVGRPEDESINYDVFCKKYLPHHSLGFGVSSTVDQSYHHGITHHGRDQDVSSGSYTNARVLARLQELHNEGRDPRSLLETFDLDLTGLVSARQFRDVVARTELLQTEQQLQRAVADFTSVRDRSMINYDDFCRTLEAMNPHQRPRSNSPLRQSRNKGPLSIRTGENDGFEYDDPYDDRAVRRSRERWDIPNDLDEGSQRYEDLDAPKLSRSTRFDDSFDGGASTRAMRRLSPTRYGSSNFSSSFDKSGSSSALRSARVSPSRMGPKMWGEDVPMNKKGVPINLDRDSWTCRVCMYVENPITTKKCGICESPNYESSKDYQLKEECMNCMFMNGYLATVCEMCNTPLGHGTRDAQRQSVERRR